MDKHQVSEIVRERLQSCHPGGVTLEVVEEAMQLEDNYWYIPVKPSAQPPHTFEYYDALAEVETDLSLNGHLKVFLVPTLPEEQRRTKAQQNP
ncbi:MAG: hypothetical protein FJZ47_13750 [Candidatus Tectomicrobia bacterium]|uniref:Uncharacterized protein n=1 Tax=Tectimicrobiota bacterium TaxID=2528274 RepID=A0A937W0Y7_UNCTE|nr:hypothetical protein [Candidatus Tectomicrobia bacterium]